MDKLFSFKSLSSGYKFRRFLAFIIDISILLMLLQLCYSVFSVPDFPAVQLALVEARASVGTALANEKANLMNTLFYRACILSLVIWFLYTALSSLILKGATVGKFICKFSVESIKPSDGFVKTYIRTLFRYAIESALIYTVILFIISTLTIFSNREKRTGIDIFAGTMVVDLKPV